MKNTILGAMVTIANSYGAFNNLEKDFEQMQLEKTSIQGYLLATRMINIYFEENKDTATKDLKAIRKDLKRITKSLKVDIESELKEAWDFFELHSNDTSVSVLSFAFQLIIKNPIVRDVFLKERCFKLAKEHMFSTELEVKNSKVLVNKFYNREVENV